MHVHSVLSTSNATASVSCSVRRTASEGSSRAPAHSIGIPASQLSLCMI
jgi:hypothetical protein